MEKIIRKISLIVFIFIPILGILVWRLFCPPASIPLFFLVFQLALIWGFIFFKDLRVISFFAFFSTLAGIGIIALSPLPIKLAVLIQTVLLWLMIGFFSFMKNIFVNKKQEKEQYFFHLEEELKNLQIENRDKGKQAEFNEEKIARYRNLSSVARTLSSAIELKSMRQLLIDLVQQLTGMKTVQIESFLADGLSMDPFENWIYRKQSALLVRDLQQDLRFNPEHCPIGLVSLLIVPIFQGKKIIALIRLEDPRPKIFQEEDLRLLAILADLVSLAMDNASLFAKVQELAIKDHLTGVYTQKFFLERLQEETLRAGRFRAPLFLIMLDIDHFKKYNDNFGHQAGDEVLRRVVKVLLSLVEEISFVARYGGEEFVVLLPQTKRERAFDLAETIRQKISEEKFVFGDKTVNLTVSLGVAGFPEDATIPSQLVRTADEFMYQAKNKGRNQVQGKKQ
ncbi:MAG: sensor domain-containing diguanylate cyclase [Elusimicrobiota bacterium]